MDPNDSTQAPVRAADPFADTAPTEISGPPDTRVGQRVAGRFEILSVLGQGGMGTVYRARQLAAGQGWQREVALKLMSREAVGDPRVAKRFAREMEATTRVAHPNTVRLYDVGTTDEGEPFLAMELVAGVPLADLLAREGRLPAERVAWLGLQVARSLEAAHARGVVHRDLKPANLMVGDLPGQPDHVTVLDFGIARFLEGGVDGQGTVLTRSGAVLGTARYMAPEQAKGAKVDHRADLYSLGVVLYEAATGRAPFEAASTVALLYMQAHERPRPPRAVCPDVPVWLDALITRMLEKDPSARPQSAGEVAERLAAAVGPKGQGSAVSGLPRRGRWRAWLLAVAVAFGVVVLGKLAVQASSGAPEPTPIPGASGTLGTPPAGGEPASALIDPPPDRAGAKGKGKAKKKGKGRKEREKAREKAREREREREIEREIGRAE